MGGVEKYHVLYYGEALTKSELLEERDLMTWCMGRQTRVMFDRRVGDESSWPTWHREMMLIPNGTNKGKLVPIAEVPSLRPDVPRIRLGDRPAFRSPRQFYTSHRSAASYAETNPSTGSTASTSVLENGRSESLGRYATSNSGSFVSTSHGSSSASSLSLQYNRKKRIVREPDSDDELIDFRAGRTAFHTSGFKKAHGANGYSTEGSSNDVSNKSASNKKVIIIHSDSEDEKGTMVINKKAPRLPTCTHWDLPMSKMLDPGTGFEIFCWQYDDNLDDTFFRTTAVSVRKGCVMRLNDYREQFDRELFINSSDTISRFEDGDWIQTAWDTEFLLVNEGFLALKSKNAVVDCF